MDQAPARIELQPAASGIWLELDGDPGHLLDQLIEQVESHAREGRCPAVISAPFDLIDTLEASLREPGVELLIDPSPADRAIALARVASWTKAKNAAVKMTFRGIPAMPGSANCPTKSAA
jgi:hypothetical protein